MAGQVSKYLIKFQRNPDLPLHLSHGVFGGVTPAGEIELNFFCESEDLPEKVERFIDNNDGSVLKEETFAGDDDTRYITRTVTSRIVVSYTTAQSLRAWLDDQLSLMDEFSAGGLSAGYTDPHSGPKQ